MTRLTAIVLTYNESAHIEDCLKSLEFADNRIVFDSFSTDDTVNKARIHGASVIQHAFENYTAQRNQALNEVKGKTDWVLFVDADERVTPELAEEVRQVIMQRDCVGYRIPRFNYIFGKLTRGAGWYPDYQTRLLKVGSAEYDRTRQVHEVVQLKGELGTMQNHFVHHNYRDLAHFMDKQRKYTQYDARMLFEQGIRPKPQNYILQPIRQFKWRFLELKGYQDGWHGFKLSTLMAWYEFRKYWILRSLWQNQ